MKKFIACLVACIAFTQSSYAALSPLSNSLREYEAIERAISLNPEFQEIIGHDEFIVDIARKTKCLDTLGKVHYRIVTRNVFNCHKRKCFCVTLIVAPNPEFECGPRLVVVVSIKPDRCHRRDCDGRDWDRRDDRRHERDNDEESEE